ncbi:MAG: hypothetical protein JWM04_182 [Verrucomicrobiales bacterium]|jgi:hypothetical protein|nr:hypothetical protein [Verrucomicrobiales bacterium]
MGFLKKKKDPISQRARALNAEIAALEGKIKKLSSQAIVPPEGPRVRSTTLPHGHVSHSLHESAPRPGSDPIFEEVDQRRLKSHENAPAEPEHYNELGVRKYDLSSLIQRLINQFKGKSNANPKLVSYLAAGSIQGLRPLRYEKRIARNRFLFVTVLLMLVVIGLISFFLRHH